MFQASQRKLTVLLLDKNRSYGTTPIQHLSSNIKKGEKKIKIPLQCKLVETISKTYMSKIYDCTNKRNAPGFKRYQALKN